MRSVPAWTYLYGEGHVDDIRQFFRNLHSLLVRRLLEFDDEVALPVIRQEIVELLEFAKQGSLQVGVVLVTVMTFQKDITLARGLEFHTCKTREDVIIDMSYLPMAASNMNTNRRS